jgi:hypothetical protein
VSEAIRGAFGSGSVLVYTTPRDHLFRLEMLLFTLTCGAAAGIHKARVRFVDTTISQNTAILRDLNEGGANEVLNYTYGIGLSGAACVTVTGWDLTVALPDTVLATSTQIWVESVTDAGVTIAADAISSVVLYGPLDDAIDNTSPAVPLIGGLLPGVAA